METINEENLTEFCQKVKSNDIILFPAYIIMVYREKNPKLLVQIMQELKVKTSELDTIIKEAIKDQNLLMIDILLKYSTKEELRYYLEISDGKAKKFIKSKLKYTDSEKEKILQFIDNPVIRKKMKIKMLEYYSDNVNIEDLSVDQKVQIIDKILEEHWMKII